jgi:hypothetical protein
MQNRKETVMKKTLYFLAGLSALLLAFSGMALAGGPPPGGDVPEPSTMALLATGGCGVGAWLLAKARGRK